MPQSLTFADLVPPELKPEEEGPFADLDPGPPPVKEELFGMEREHQLALDRNSQFEPGPIAPKEAFQQPDALEDRPFPKSVPEALKYMEPEAAAWADDPDVQLAFLHRAEQMTFAFEREAGLSGPRGPIAGYTREDREKTKGAFLDKLVRLYAPASPRERHESILLTADTLISSAKEAWIGRMNELKAVGDTDGITAAQQTFAKLQALQSRVATGDPSATQEFTTALKVALEATAPGAQRELSLSALLQHGPDAQPSAQGRPGARVLDGQTTTTLPPRDVASISALIETFDQTRQGSGVAWGEAAHSAWQGALQQVRLQEHGLGDGRGMLSSLVNSHPNHSLKMAANRTVADQKLDRNPQNRIGRMKLRGAMGATAAITHFQKLDQSPLQPVLDAEGNQEKLPDGKPKFQLVGSDPLLTPRPLVDAVRTAVEDGFTEAVAGTISLLEPLWKTGSSVGKDFLQGAYAPGDYAQRRTLDRVKTWNRGMKLNDPTFQSIAFGDGTRSLGREEANALFNPENDMFAWATLLDKGSEALGQIGQDVQTFSPESGVPEMALQQQRFDNLEKRFGIGSGLKEFTQEEIDTLTGEVSQFYQKIDWNLMAFSASDPNATINKHEVRGAKGADQTLDEKITPLDALGVATYYATQRFAFEQAQIFRGLYADPKNTAKMVGVLALAGTGAAVGLSPLRQAATRRMTAAVQARRALTVIGEMGRRSPEHLSVMRTQMAINAKTATTGRAAKMWNQGVDRAETLLRLHDSDAIDSLGVPTKNEIINWQTVTLKKTLRQLRTPEMLDFFESLPAGAEAHQLVQMTSHRGAVGALVESVQARFGHQPGAMKSIFARKLDSAAEEIAGLLDDRGTIPDRVKFGGAAVNDLVGEYSSTMTEMRGLIGEQRVRQELLLEYIRTKHTNSRTVLESLAQADDGLDIKAAINQVGAAEARIGNTISSLKEGAAWERRVELSKSNNILDSVETDELLDFVSEAIEPLGLEGVYSRMAPDGISFEAWSERINKQLDGPKAKGLKKRIMEQYFDSDGLRDNVLVDRGTVLDKASGRKAKARAARYAKDVELLQLAAEGADDISQRRLLNAQRRIDLVDEHGGPPELERVDLKKPIEDLQRLAASDKALGALNLAESTSMSSDGTVRTMVANIRNADHSERIAAFAANARIARLAEYIQDRPAAKAAWAKSVELRKKNGAPEMTYRQLKEKFPEEFEGLPVTPDETVQYMLEREKTVRAGVLHDMHEAGLITARQARDLVEGFSPQSWKLFDDQIVDNKEHGAAAGSHSTTGQANGEFMMQRDVHQYRAIVHLDGAPPRKRRFDTAAEADAWLAEEHGLRTKLQRTDDGVRSALTDTGHKAEVLDPIGLETANIFGTEKTLTSWVRSTQQLVEDIYRHRLYQAVNRPGIALTRGDMNTLMRRGATRKDFTAQPLGDEYGPLAGKFVHKDTIRNLQAFNGELENMTTLARSLQKEAKIDWSIANLGGIAMEGLRQFGQFRKNQIIAKITRDPMVMMWNVVGDRFIFGHGATEGKLMSSIEGKRARATGRQAMKELHRFRRRAEAGKANGQMSALMDELHRAGMMDEMIVGRQTPHNLRQILVEEEFGKSPGFKSEVGKFIEGLIPESMRKNGVYRAMFDDAPDAQLDSLISEQDRLATTLSTVDPKSSTATKLIVRKAAIDEKIKLAKTSAQSSWARLVRGAQHVFTQRKGGRFSENSIMAREFYADLSLKGRIDTYFYWKERGLSEAAAAAKTNAMMQTFSSVPNAVRQASRIGLISPTAGFLTESLRIMGNWAMWNWPMFAGYFGALPVTNFTTMLTSGMSPYDANLAFNASDGSRSMSQHMTQQLLLPGEDGQMTAQASALVIGPMQRRAAGSVGKFADSIAPGGWLGKVTDMPLNYLSNIFSGVALTTAIPLFMGHDPATGRKTTDISHSIWATAEEVLRSSFPGNTPGIGSATARFWENEKKPPMAYSGNMRTLAERGLQFGGQIRARTDLNFKEKMRWSITKAKSNSADGSVDRATDPNFFDARQAIENGDGEELVDAMERMAAIKEFEDDIGSIESVRKMTDRERIAVIKRLTKLSSPERTFEGLTMRQKADALINMSHAEMTDVDVDLLTRFFESAVRTGTGGLQMPTNPDTIRTTVRDYKAAALSPAILPEIRLKLAGVAAFLEMRLPRAEFGEQKERVFDEDTRQAVEIFKKAFGRNPK